MAAGPVSATARVVRRVLNISCLVAMTWSCPAPALADEREPTCIRSPGPDGEKVSASLIASQLQPTRRVIFHFGKNALVVDHVVLDYEIDRFLREHGADRFPEERRARDGLRRAAARTNEVDGDRWLLKDPARRLTYHLATVLERGAFEIRAGTLLVHGVYRISWSQAWARGRRFFTPTCEPLFEILDGIS